MADKSNSLYQQHYQQASSTPEAFWQQQAAALSWYKTPNAVLTQQDEDHYQWFSDGVLNNCRIGGQLCRCSNSNASRRRVWTSEKMRTWAK